MKKIKDFILEKHKYKVDTNYQRPAGAWSTEDNQCLIDTILKNEPMPLFFLNFKSGQGDFYIVDGQQRLHAIKLFCDNKLKLNKKFSGEENHGKTFNGDNPLDDEQRNNFLNYTLNFKILEDYDDEKIRMVFSRLQRGKPLTLGERLNAMPGDIVLTMREIASHPFMNKSIGIVTERYGHYPDAARILYYEKYGCKDSGTPAIVSFFDENKKITKTGKSYRNVIQVLNYLEKCFPQEPGGYMYLSKHAWVFAAYTMVRELMLTHAMYGKEDEARNFIESFHNKVYAEDFRSSNPTYQRFYDNVRGGWSERLIALRRNILINEFLAKKKIEEKDEKRQITEEQKIEIFEKQHRRCQMCGTTFKDYGEPEYHHKIMYAEGGKSEIDNIEIFCKKCHDEQHRQMKKEMTDMTISVDSSTEIEEDEYENGNNNSSYTGKKPISMKFNNKTYEDISSWRDILVTTCEVLSSAHKDEFRKNILGARGNKRYFTVIENELRRPKLIKGTDIYVETNLSANDIMKRCFVIIKLFGYTEDSLKVETN